MRVRTDDQLIRAISRAAACDVVCRPPFPWATLPLDDDGQGVQAVGFSDLDPSVFVSVLVDGVIVFDLNENRVLCEEFGWSSPLAGVSNIGPLLRGWGAFSEHVFYLSGADSGGLPQRTYDGWEVARVTATWPVESALLIAPDSLDVVKIVPDCSNLRALGFSLDGSTLVTAEPMLISIWRRPLAK